MTKTGKAITLDPIMNNMSDSLSQNVRQVNWTILVREMKKLGITVGVREKEKLIEGDHKYLKVSSLAFLLKAW